MPSPDALLLDRWMQGGDPEAFRALVERHSAMVYATARRILPSPDQAEDVTQQCFLKLAQDGGARTSLPGWLHRVATNFALTLLRTETRRKRAESGRVPETAAPAEASWEEVEPLIDAALEALPFEQRVPVIEHVLRGRTHNAIARELGLTREAVGYRIRTGIEGIRTFLRTHGTDAAAAVLPEADGGFVVAGATASMGPGFHNALLLRVDASGDAIWSRAFGGDGYDNADAVEPTSDGGYVLAGFTESFGAPGRNMYVVKTDAEGKELWSGVYGGEEEDAAAAARRTADGGYIVAGYSMSPDTGEPRLYIVKTDAAGTETWSRIYEDYGGAFSISERPGGEGYEVTGSRQWSSVAYTLTIDAQGEEIAARMFPGLDHARAIEDLGEEGAVVFGSRYIPERDQSEVVILRFDSQGDNLWSLPLAGCDCGAAFRRTADGRCVVVDGEGDGRDVRVTLFGRETRPFRRGELDANGVMDIADAICILAYLFGPETNACTARAAECPDAADANDDGRVDIADAIRILGSLFSSAGPLPEPAAACGNDESWDDLRCYRFEECP